MKNRHIKSKQCMTAFSPLADSLDGLFCFLSTELTYFSSCLSVEGLRVSKSISISSGLLSFSAGSLAWMMYTTRPSFSPGIDTVSIKTTRRNHQSLLRITRVHSLTQTLILTEYSGTSENGLPLLGKPPQCGQESAVPNCIALYYSCYKETSVLRTPPK